MDFETLNNAIIKCNKCTFIKSEAPSIVGEGSFDAQIIFVCDEVGSGEEKESRPLADKAEKLLRVFIASIGLDVSDVYITSLVKCSSERSKEREEEQRANCLPFLRMEYKLLKPRIVVCLGEVVAKHLIREDFDFQKEHGTYTEKQETFFVATYKMKDLVRDPANRFFCSEDFKKIRQLIIEHSNVKLVF